jgi:acetyltransferase-like isoleucine patch superfamily enzyme
MKSIAGERPQPLFWLARTVFWLYQAALYFLSLLGPAALIYRFRGLGIPFLLLAVIGAFHLAGLIFISLLVITKRAIIGPLPDISKIRVGGADGDKWFAASMSVNILIHSPFWWMVTGLSPVAAPYYRGMGAKMAGSVFLGARSILTDPWFVELGEHVTIGLEAVILGHLGNGDEVILGRVVIETGAVIGMRAVIFPDVRVGKGALVGAGAVVVRGAVIGEGEVWAGVPARRIACRKVAEDRNDLPHTNPEHDSALRG